MKAGDNAVLMIDGQLFAISNDGEKQALYVMVPEPDGVTHRIMDQSGLEQALLTAVEGDTLVLGQGDYSITSDVAGTRLNLKGVSPMQITINVG